MAERAFPAPRRTAQVVALVGRGDEFAHLARSLAAAWGSAGIKVGIQGAGEVALQGVVRVKRKDARRPPRSVQRLLRVSAKRPARDAEVVLLTARDAMAQGLVVLLGPVLAGQALVSFRVHAPGADVATQVSWQPLLLALEAWMRG